MTVRPWVQALTIAVLISSDLPAGADFSFQFTFGSCTLDTATGMLTHDNQPRVRTPVKLGDQEMVAIAEAADALHFFDYPSTFVGVPPGLAVYSINVSATSYRLEARRAGSIHAVSWTDSTRPTTEAADRLRALFERIIGFIADRRGLEAIARQGLDCR